MAYEFNQYKWQTPSFRNKEGNYDELSGAISTADTGKEG